MINIPQLHENPLATEADKLCVLQDWWMARWMWEIGVGVHTTMRDFSSRPMLHANTCMSAQAL